MRPRLFLSLLVAACTLAGTAQAAEKLVVLPAVLDSNAFVGENIRRECGIEGSVSREVLQRVGERFPDVQRNQGSSQDGESLALKVTILAVSGAGGGSWSGPKSMSVKAEVLLNGTVAVGHVLRRSSTGGPLGGTSGTCAILDRVAVALGKDVAGWLQGALLSARNMPVAQPAPVETRP